MHIARTRTRLTAPPVNRRSGLYLPTQPTAPVYAVVTDTGTTPASTALSLPAWASGFRIVTGETAVTEADFDLYYQINSGTVKKVRMTRWKDRFFPASAGSSIKLSTSDGRTVGITPVALPSSLTAPSAVSGTANADRAGPPLWTPAAAHVTLADYHQTINLAATDATERVVFVSEHDGTGWTQPRWYWLPSTGSINVLCSFKRVAIANYAGVAVTVTAPVGAVIGGTSVTPTLPFPTVTGTTWSVSDSTTWNAAKAGAVSGAEIVFTSGGAFAATNTDFTANRATGRNGAEGITFRSQNAGSPVTLTGTWTFAHDGTAAGTNDVTVIRNINWNLSGVAGQLSMVGGRWLVDGVTVTGANTGGLPLVSIQSNTNRRIEIDLHRVTANNGGEDCFDGNGAGAGHANNTASRVRLINCSGSVAGSASQDQVITTHNGLSLEVYGGVFSDAVTNVIAPDSVSGSDIRMFFVTTGPGARQGAVSGGAGGLYGCDVTVAAAAATTTTNAVYSKVTGSGFVSSTSLFRVSAVGAVITQVRHNRISANSGRGFFASVGNQQGFDWNILTGFSEAFRLDNYTATGSTAASTITGNTIASCTTGVSGSTTNLPIVVRHTAFRSNTTNLSVGAGVATGSFNVASAFDADYSGSNDTTASAALDTTAGPTLHLPTAAGNCDATGNAALLDWVGGSDPWGWVLVYASSLTPRGARSRPATTGDLHPDVWA